MPVVYAFSILVRPVGIALLPIFGFIFRKRVYTYLILLLILFFAAGFNYFTADQFTISDFNLDSRQDGMLKILVTLTIFLILHLVITTQKVIL